MYTQFELEGLRAMWFAICYFIRHNLQEPIPPSRYTMLLESAVRVAQFSQTAGRVEQRKAEEALKDIKSS